MRTALPTHARRPPALAAALPSRSLRPGVAALAPLPPRRPTRRSAAVPAAAIATPFPLPPPLAALPSHFARLALTLARSLVLVAAAGAAATVAALAATGASSAVNAAAHPAVWALVASFLGARMAARSARADARRLRSALADHSETLAGIERGVAVRKRGERGQTNRARIFPHAVGRTRTRTPSALSMARATRSESRPCIQAPLVGRMGRGKAFVGPAAGRHSPSLE